MLRQLNIRNLALIESLTLDLQAGFTALTGETGAGKSILLDALGLTLGTRADTKLVRHGARQADVQTVFDLTFLPEIQHWLAEEALLDEEDPHTLTLRRVVRKDGGSQAWINGIRAPLAQLKQLAAQLVDIHSQHAQQQLLNTQYQRRLLDAFGQLEPLRQQVSEQWKQWQAARNRLEAHTAQRDSRDQQLFQLRQQLDELEPLQPSTDTYQRLSQRQSQLAHAQMLYQNSQQALVRLEEHPQGAIDQLNQAIQALEPVVEIDNTLAPLLKQLTEQLVILEESARDLHHYQRTLSLDPQELAEVENQLAEYHRLARKFLVEPEALEQHRMELRQQYETLLHFDDQQAELEMAEQRARDQFMDKAQQLHAARKQAAQQLQKQVETLIHPLGLPHARFDIQIRMDEAFAGPHGLDEVRFMMTANPGQPMMPLDQVASGGEMSRISLAIEVALAETAGLPVLIFDEADVGIGGGTAEQVGRLMRRLGRHRQVLAITHQPQVAACAHTHLQVSKRQTDTSTHTTVTPLDTAQRVEELARMLGGTTLTDTTRQHAREMLSLAQGE